MNLKLFFASIILLAAVAITFHNPAHGAVLAMPFFAWFTNIFDGIGAYWRKIMNKAKPFLHKEIPVVISIVNVLKYAVENPLIDFATAAIPGNVDELIVAKAKQILPDLLVQLKLLDIAVNTDSNAAIIEAAIAYLRSIAPEKRYGKYLEIANYLTEALIDGKLSWPEIVHVVQLAHDEKVETLVQAA